MTSVKDKIDTMTTKQKGIEERWQEARWQVSLYKAGISDATKAIKGDIDNNITWVNNLIKEYKKLATQINNMPSYSSGGGSGGGGWSGTVVGGSGTSGGEFAPTSGTQHGNIGGGTITTVISPGVWFDETGGHSGGAPEVDDNPWLMAEGGLVTKPTSAIIGEAGPELVIPLSKLTSSSSNDTDGNQTISIGNSICFCISNI